MKLDVNWYEVAKGELPAHSHVHGCILYITHGGMAFSGNYKNGLFGHFIDENGDERGLRPERVKYWCIHPLLKRSEVDRELSTKIYEDERPD